MRHILCWLGHSWTYPTFDNARMRLWHGCLRCGTVEWQHPVTGRWHRR